MYLKNIFLFISCVFFLESARSQDKNWTKNFLIENKKIKFSLGTDESLKGIDLYRRCYQMLIRYPLSIENPTAKKIIAGSISAEVACVDLVDAAHFDDGGILIHPNLSAFETQRLMLTFQMLHSSWFDAYSFSFSGENFGTGEFSDFEQMGYVLSNALFKNKKISSTLVGKEIFSPIRDEKNTNEYLLSRNPYSGQFHPWDHIGLFYDDGTKIETDLPHAPRGALRGIKIDNTPYFLKKYYIQYEKFYENTTTALQRHFGGGLIGSSTYLLLNMGDKVGVIQDGDVRISRRWTRSVIKDVLCRNLPVLEIDDAKKYIAPNSKNSFSKTQSCVQCHATMDTFAGAIRDVQGGVNATGGLDFDTEKNLLKNSKIGFSYLRSVNDSKLLQRKDHPYAFAAPTGRLRLRDFQGREVDQSYKNLDDLGSQLSKLDDFYMCQTKRYFKFLTGIEVETDPLILKSLNLKNDDKQILTQIYIWAMQLKKEQQTKKLIEKIIKSPFFQHKNFYPIKE